MMMGPGFKAERRALRGGQVDGVGEESMEPVAAGAGGRDFLEGVIHDLRAVRALEAKHAVALHKVVGEVAAGAEDHERFGGGGEQAAEVGKELHGGSFRSGAGRRAGRFVRCLFGLRQGSLRSCRIRTGNVSANGLRINGIPAVPPALFIDTDPRYGATHAVRVHPRPVSPLAAAARGPVAMAA
jgi:hypothetical protein